MTSREDHRRADLLARIEPDAVPTHIAVIMDGNGRWASERGLPRWMGHREGMKAVRAAVEAAVEVGCGYLTLYAFSQENWSRSDAEVSALMQLLCEYVEREKADLRKRGVRVRVFGQLDRLGAAARKAVEDLERTTAGGGVLQVNLAISYGAREEILQAVRRLGEQCGRGEIATADITEERFAAELWTAGWPDPDLLVRTSGEQRISNFLLWQIAYAEIYVTPLLWPDFRHADMYAAILDFQSRERRFGRVKA